MNSPEVVNQLRQHEKLAEIKSIVTVITSTMVLPLYFLFWICDLIYAPQLKWEFLALRATIIPLAITIQYFTARVTTLSSAYYIAFAYTSLIGLPISIMVLLLADPGTPYYAGLNLVAIATLTFLPLTPVLFVLAVLSIYGPYYIIVLNMSQNANDYRSVLVATFFIVSTVIICWVVRMFTERMRRHEVAQRLELNREIEQRKQMELSVRHAHDEAVAANKSKSDFMANMSHELRTPLNAIIGYSELLQDTATDDGLEGYTADLQKISNGGKHLLNLINNMLDLSKIEAGRMEVLEEEVVITNVMQNIDVIARPLAAKNNNQFNIKVHTQGAMCTDETRLHQVLLNLIGNACKFTKDGQVTVSVTDFNIDSRPWLCFEVADTGIGMTEEQYSKIFQPYVQAEPSTTRDYGGTGLGLTISRQFSRLLGGDIRVRSEPGIGTAFSVLLPRKIPQATTNTQAVAG